MGDIFAEARAEVLAEFKAIPAKRYEMKVSESSYDPIEDENYDAANTKEFVWAINLPASKGTIQAFDKSYSGDLASKDIKFFKVVPESLEYEPRNGHSMIIDGETWRVLGTTAIKPTDTAIIFNMGVRRQ